MWKAYPKWTSLTFHYCTVICEVLRPIDVIFWKRQHKLYLIFRVSNMRLSVNVQKPSVSASAGLRPSD